MTGMSQIGVAGFEDWSNLAIRNLQKPSVVHTWSLQVDVPRVTNHRTRFGEIYY